MTAALLALCGTALALAASPDLRARIAGYAGFLESGALTPAGVADALRGDLKGYSGPADGERLIRAALDIVEPVNAFCRWCGTDVHNPHAETLRDLYGVDDRGRLRDACRPCMAARSKAPPTFGVLPWLDDDADAPGLAHLGERGVKLPDDTWRDP